VTAAADRIGRTIGNRFRVDEVIGRGAMADVYRALDLQTHTYVALKILRHTHLSDATSRSRFAREAEVQAKLRHRNVAALFASGLTEHDEPFLAVELLRGKTLRGVIKSEHRVAPVRAASYAWQALSGLQAVHAQGVMHRDLKPANIMLEPSPGPVDRVVLIDFGFATFEGSERLTAVGTVVGSLSYIAPERLRGELIDGRADLYAIGIILFELLVGEPPFRADDDLALIDLQLSEPAPHVCAFDPTLPPPLDATIARALEKDPADRFGSAREMADELEAAAQLLHG
jgi:serine/threonine-protein kinase